MEHNESSLKIMDFIVEFWKRMLGGLNLILFFPLPKIWYFTLFALRISKTLLRDQMSFF